MKTISDIGGWFLRVYDKLLVLVVFAGLVASVVLLAMRVGSIQKLDRDYEEKIDGLTPKHAYAAEATSEVFDQAMQRLSSPPQIPEWTNALTFPETRVWCIDCRQPILFVAEVCPFCDGKQPSLKDIWFKDEDGDGLPDGFESENGLSSTNPRDAMEDADGDLFTNLDEYTHKTDINDPNDYPPIEDFLTVSKIAAIPFDLLFKSHMRGAGDNRTFAINTRDDGRTYFVKLGQDVEGFEVMAFERKSEPHPGIPGQERDVSVLTLRKGGHTIPLVRGAGLRYEDFTIEFFFRLENRVITAKLGDDFQLRKGRVYKVMEVDTAQKNVVIRRSDGKKFTVGSFDGGNNG